MPSSSNTAATDSPSQNFVLPGIPIVGFRGAVKIDISYAFTLSYVTNPRNLESYAYGFWAMILAHLTYDLPTMVVVPQYMLYHKKWSENQAPDPDTSITSIRTEPDATANAVIPDFAIVHVRGKWNTRQTPRTYRNITISGAGLPVLIEVKRFCSRTHKEDSDAFSIAMATLFLEAEIALEIQARHLFRRYSKQQSVILMACVGDWWEYELARKADFMPLWEEDYVELAKPTDDADTAGDDLEEGSSYEESYEEEDSIDPLDIMFLEEGHVGSAERQNPQIPAKRNGVATCSVLPEDQLEAAGRSQYRWSGIMQINSPPSNQRMFVVHKILEDVAQTKTSYSRG
jgi:hypothetical protein